LSLCSFLTDHHAMKAYWGMEVQLQAFLTSALNGGEHSASRCGRFTPQGKSPGTNWTGGGVSPRAGLEAVVKRKIPSLCRDSKPKTQYKKRWLNLFSRFKDIRHTKQLADYRPIEIIRPGRPLDYWTDRVVRPKRDIYWPNLVTIRRRR
jgi:hypothetical protein